MSERTTFTTIPTLTRAPTAHGDLKQVQTWKNAATSKEIGKY